MHEPVKKSPGLYVHIPFCRNKCPYCGFYSISSNSLIKRWLKALKTEVTLYKGHFNPFDTIYLGGGTPTLLEPEELSDLVQCLISCFDFAQDSEITIEANPGDLTNEKIKIIRELGFNRISLGIQSFDDHTLSYLGRKHTAREAENALEKIREHGFENIGIDLIYGIHEQSVKKWKAALMHALEFWPEHISCYQLTIEKATPFAGMKEKGVFNSLNENEEYKYFVLTSNILEKKGYIHYEISNFARDVTLLSRHNTKYWHHIPYLGLGPSSHSFDGCNRWWNVSSVRKYCEALEAGSLPVEEKETLTNKQIRIESISLGLRNTKGFDRGIIPAGKKINELIRIAGEHGLIKFNESRIIPTKKGFAVADQLASQLCAALQDMAD